jgi:hypothetical protein
MAVCGDIAGGKCDELFLPRMPARIGILIG